jgi:tRNA(fMet)-specific endonuclease VapC
MDRALLDTDICSEILRGRNVMVLQRMMEYVAVHDRLTISALTVVEIAKGLVKANRAEQLKAVDGFFDGVEVVSLDRPCARLAGEILGRLEQSGATIGRIDPMIAAIAIIHGLTLVTGNTAHYERIALLGYDLKLANWRL